MNKHLYTIDEGCRTLSVGRSKLYELIAEGKLKTVHVGRRRYITRQALDDFVNSLKPSSLDATPADYSPAGGAS